MSRRVIAFDTETYYDKECTVKELGNWGYTHHPRFDCYMVSVFDGEDAWAGHPSEFNWDALEGATLLSHNAAFDIAVYRRMTETGKAPLIDIPEWHCTANLTTALCNRRDLAGSTHYLFTPEEIEAMIGVKSVSKSERGKAEGTTYEMFRANAQQWADMCEYAVKDAILCWHIWNRFACRMRPIDHEMSDLTLFSSDRGVAVNVELLREYSKRVSEAQYQVVGSLPWVQPGVAPTSPEAITAYCEKMGFPGPPVKSQDEEAFAEWRETYIKDHPWIDYITLVRKLNKMAAFLDSITIRVRPDNTMEAPLLFYGAHTGRWAGKLGSDGVDNTPSVNFQNLRKEPLKLPDGYEVYQRHLFIPRPGHKFIIADYAQIEARVVNFLAGNQEFLDQLATSGQSIYEVHARLTMGWTGGPLKKEDPKLYALAKARVLMLGFGAGWEKFQATAFKQMGLVLTEEEARKTVTEFRATNPLITRYWNSLDNGLKNAACSASKTFVLPLPSGRSLIYPNIHSKRVMRVFEETGLDGKPTKKSGWSTQYFATIGHKTRAFYGGKLCENATQATARDIFVEGMKRVTDAGWHIPFHVHDEVVVEVPREVSLDSITELLQYCPPWANGCPVGIEAREADHYLKD